MTLKYAREYYGYIVCAREHTNEKICSVFKNRAFLLQFNSRAILTNFLKLATCNLKLVHFFCKNSPFCYYMN